MTTSAIIEHFYGNGIDARLRCHAEACALDIAIARELIDEKQPQVRLEVLLQPTDPGSGLPYGMPVKLLEETVALGCSWRHKRAHGRSWLPGISPDVAPDCFYRIVSLF